MVVITVAPETNVEAAKDALVSLLLGGEFAKFLDAEHARQAVRINIRYPEVGYIDEVATLNGYPAFEIISGPTEFGDNSPERTHELSIQWTVNGDDEQVMSREIARLTGATVAFFEQNDGTLLPFVGGKFRVDRTDIGPTSAGRDQTFVKSSAVRIFWIVFAR